MAVAIAVQLAVLTAAVSVGFVLTGAYILYTYRGIGVRGLGLFAIVWGGHFLVDSVHVIVLSAHGITSGADLGSVVVTAPLDLFLFASTPITGLLATLAIFGWLWFVLSYTTKLDRIDEISLLVAGAFVFVVLAVNGLVGVTTSLGYFDVEPRIRSDFHSFATLIEILGTGVAISAGIGQLYATAKKHRLVTLGVVVSLSVPVIVPYLVRYVYQLGVIVDFRTIGVVRTLGLTIGLIGLWVAIDRYGVFDQLPASQTVGRDTAFHTTETPIVVLGADGRIVDLNLAGETLIDAPDGSGLGERIEDVFSGAVDGQPLREEGRTEVQFPNDDRTIEAQTTTMTDDRGREIGATIVFKDLTEERHRQQRIEVLNRVLRHNLRNELTLGFGYLDHVEAKTGPDESTRALRSVLDELVGIGEKARDLEYIIQVDATVEQWTELGDIVAEALEHAEYVDDGSSIEIGVPDDVRVRTNPEILRAVLAELIENAVEHADGGMATITFDSATNTIAVCDRGDGIPEHELTVFERERETPLRHASGLGLWLVKLGVDRFGGDVEFETSADGTLVEIGIPHEQLARDDGRAGEEHVT